VELWLGAGCGRGARAQLPLTGARDGLGRAAGEAACLGREVGEAGSPLGGVELNGCVGLCLPRWVERDGARRKKGWFNGGAWRLRAHLRKSSRSVTSLSVPVHRPVLFLCLFLQILLNFPTV